MHLSPGRIDMPFPKGMRVDYVSLYAQREAAAQQAVRRNGGALWYVGNDPTGFVFEDSVGTLPATGTDPIGLLLDRSYGTSNLTPELISDPDFNTPAAWTVVQPTSGVSSVSGGNFNLQTLDGSNTYCLPVGVTAVAGLTYRFSVNVTAVSGTVGVQIGGTLFPITSSGTYTGALIAASSGSIEFKRGAPGVPASATVASFSVKQVLGFPALQATAGNRPTLELQANGCYGMQFDGTTDSLATTLPQPAAGGTIVAYSQSTLAFRCPVGYSDSVANTTCFKFRNNGDVWCRAGSGGANDIFMLASYAAGVPGVFSHVWDASTHTGYVNGVAKGTGAMPGAWVGGVGAATFGFPPSSVDLRANGPLFLWCELPVKPSDPDRIAIERFAALLSGATYP